MQPDVNCDGYVNVNDLLGLLGYYGDEDLDGDGIWDDQDDCVEDECGVCDGPGPQVLAVDTITFTIDSIFVEAIDEWYVFEVPDTLLTIDCTNPGCTDPMAENYDPYASEDDQTCTYGGPEQCAGLLTLTYDNHIYNLVAIGEQCWFAENLETEHFSNGTEIPEQPGSGWSGTDQPAWCQYHPDYGYLYNTRAMLDSSGLCPSGWRVPSDEDWLALSDFAGGAEIAGEALKATADDFPSWDGLNSFGFSAVPGGSRIGNGEWYDFGSIGIFWSTTPRPEFGEWGYSAPFMYTGDSQFNFENGSNAGWVNDGFSVRCIKD